MKILQDWNDELKDTESKAFKVLSARLKTEVKTVNVFPPPPPYNSIVKMKKPR